MLHERSSLAACAKGFKTQQRRFFQPPEHVVRDGRVREFLGILVVAQMRDPRPSPPHRAGPPACTTLVGLIASMARDAIVSRKNKEDAGNTPRRVPRHRVVGLGLVEARPVDVRRPVDRLPALALAAVRLLDIPVATVGPRSYRRQVPLLDVVVHVRGYADRPHGLFVGRHLGGDAPPVLGVEKLVDVAVRDPRIL